MDGNRRWAKSQNKTTSEGHENGFEKLRDVKKKQKIHKRP
jgi:undecaprenyl diphosphate synthase